MGKDRGRTGSLLAQLSRVHSRCCGELRSLSLGLQSVKWNLCFTGDCENKRSSMQPSAKLQGTPENLAQTGA